jgi:transcription initiation factor IIE alpha subunit
MNQAILSNQIKDTICKILNRGNKLTTNQLAERLGHRVVHVRALLHQLRDAGRCCCDETVSPVTWKGCDNGEG